LSRVHHDRAGHGRISVATPVAGVTRDEFCSSGVTLLDAMSASLFDMSVTS
jgi:hypothetical protein